MLAKFKQFELQALDRNLAHTTVCHRPATGWIRTIRTALGMSTRQLAERIGITQQSASRLETNEANDVITLKSLRRAAEAMDCQLVYAFAPKHGNLQKQLKHQALKKAKELVDPVNQSMLLEAQDVGDRQARLEQLADELAQKFNRQLWD